MAHLLDFSTGKAGIAIRRGSETPWHGFGFEVEGNNVDEWRVAAGLAWDVEKRQVYYSQNIDGKRVPTPVDDRFALVRSDNQAALGLVSNRYQTVQPRDVLEFYRDLVADAGWQLETAGSLLEGRRIWALARTGAEVRIAGTDLVKGYCLLATSFDGSLATQAQFTSVRVVCNNTLQLSRQQDGAGAVKVRHSTRFNELQVKADLGIAGEAWDSFERDASHLAEHRVTDAEVTTFFEKVLGPECYVAGREDRGASPKLKAIIAGYLGGHGAELRSAKGTAWGLVNAVTEFVDHTARTRGGDGSQRINSAWFGAGADLKSKAWEAALAIAA